VVPASCSHLLFGPGIQEAQRFGPDPFLPNARAVRAIPGGQIGGQALQPIRELAAASLQIAQIVKDDSICDCG
jgi:hypothetical protein